MKQVDMKQVMVSGPFDNIASTDIRFLDEASRLGSVRVLLWDDLLAQQVAGSEPQFPLAERRYFVESIRFVDRVTVAESLEHPDALPIPLAETDNIWAIRQSESNLSKQTFCQTHGLQLHTIEDAELRRCPEPAPIASTGKPRVLVTGCYDWFHTGHVRFFEEVAELGELYVVVGHDKNIELLKGEGHPMFKQEIRRYMAGSIRFVHQALISSGEGWLDAEPEIQRIQPDIYAVNEDGDRPEKRDYCQTHGIEYHVLQRMPKEGLPQRQSTDLRGF